MNSQSTKHGPYEYSSPTRDWQMASERRSIEHSLSGLTTLAYGAALLAVIVFGLYVAAEPLFATVAAYLGVK